jgi:DNA polymerase-4
VDTYLDDAYLDMSGTHRLYPNVRLAAAFLKKIIRDTVGLSVTLGVGPSRVVARMAGATAKPDGLCVIEDDGVDRFLLSKPVEDLVGVGRKTAARLRLLGIRTIGQMRSLPKEGFQALFGRTGEVLFARCRGEDGRAIHKKEIPTTISRETTLHSATTDPEEIRSMLYYLIERGMRTVRQLKIQCRTVGLRIAYSDWVMKNGQRSTAPFDLESRAFAVALRLLKNLHQRRVALRRIGVVFSQFVPGGADQGFLFEGGSDPRKQRLACAIDAVRQRYGFKALVAGPAVGLMDKMQWGEHGYVLRTPSLTK